MPELWKVEYQNDEMYEGFYEWWEVTDGNMVFKSASKEGAEWLCETLNRKERA